MRRALPAGIIAIATARALPDAANHRAKVACYIRRYGDLARNFCRGPGDCDLAAAERHWTARGWRENRTFGCATANHARERELASRAACRWLWFAGMHEGANAAAYRSQYAAALLTARENAPVLQPVLMLGRGGLDASDGLSKFGRWAQGRGALVFNVQRLAFQEHLDRLGFSKQFGNDHAQGPYLRLHAPVLIREHNLMTAGICSDVFLYTDCDTLFLNVDAHAMTHEAARLSSHVWSFGPQKSRAEKSPQNTGVWLVNYRALVRVYSDLLRFAVARKFRFRETFDQGWIKEFSHSRRGTAIFLGPAWNYKVYWGGDARAVKIVHFHGPKPGRGAWLTCLASQNAACMRDLSKVDHKYNQYVSAGFRADGGHLANVSLGLYKAKLDSIAEADRWWDPE